MCLHAGWKFWIPASSINFWLVPVKQQVLYMSLCGVFWSAYLSYSSNLQVSMVACGGHRRRHRHRHILSLLLSTSIFVRLCMVVLLNLTSLSS